MASTNPGTPGSRFASQTVAERDTWPRAGTSRDCIVKPAELWRMDVQEMQFLKGYCTYRLKTRVCLDAFEKYLHENTEATALRFLSRNFLCAVRGSAVRISIKRWSN